MKTEIIFNKQPTDNTVYKEKVFDVVLSSGSPQGLSAYQLAVKNGFQGTEQEWLNSLRGYIPEKGVDYWTEEDKNQIFNLIPQWPLADRLAKGMAEGAIKEGAILYNAAVGENSHVEGRFTTASGDNSHAEGSATSAAGECGHAEGTNTVATGDFSHAQGESTRAMNKAQSVGGRYNEVDPSQNDPDEYGTYVEIIGNGTGSSNRSNARTLDWNGNEILAGKLTIGANPTNDMDVATKKYVDENSGGGFDLSDRIAKGTGNGAVIQGQIDGISANNASGNFSFAQGIDNTASGLWSHAEGNGTTAYGYNSHSEGGSTIANGTGSHAEGDETRADGSYSHSEGRGTITAGRSQHVSGEYNIADNSAHVYDRGTYVEIIGNGLDNENRSNARTLDWNGNEILSGKLTVGISPTNNMDVATKKYVDDGLSNIDLSNYATQSYINTELIKKQDVLLFNTPTSADIGKALMPKIIENGKVTAWEFGDAGTVQDVQVDGTSIVSDGVAEIPYATSASAGIVRTHASYGTAVTNTGMIYIVPAASNNVKEGNTNAVPLTPGRQHESTFYGLARAAGDVTQSASSNTVGNYTDNAKSAIKAMLDIGGETQTVQVSGTTPVITANQNTRYVCGEILSLDFTPSASGICDVIFTSGSTATVLTLPNTVILPSWFDSTALEANTTYEISISDGIYGAVMIW